jgi:hypothetical protein
MGGAGVDRAGHGRGLELKKEVKTMKAWELDMLL